MSQITVLSGPERRRRRSEEERLRVLTEAFSPGACVAEVCRRHDISTSLIYTWRSKLRRAHADAEPSEPSVPAFPEAVVVEEDAGRCAGGGSPSMVIDLARGNRVFCESDRGGLRAAVLYTLIQTARVLFPINKDPAVIQQAGTRGHAP
ncbi:transposase [Novosphingobium piscinae]|uniref:Transposase n=1 Tax=Novosphingobium piscinae TaxID=1507448 RepID=A0A7X1FZ92_9SPHN|nr:transposase [Novosphingobium piscinae]